MTRPFRLAPPVPPETDLQEAVAQARMGLKRSWPDVLVLHGVLHGIELKRPGGKLSRTRAVRTRRGGLRIVEGQRDAFLRCPRTLVIVPTTGVHPLPERPRAIQ